MNFMHTVCFRVSTVNFPSISGRAGRHHFDLLSWVERQSDPLGYLGHVGWCRGGWTLWLQ